MIRLLTAKLVHLGRDIKLAHSVFALPFAFLAAFLAARGVPTVAQLVLILLCMVVARTYAMLANRLVDRDFDAANPRTAGRALPAGRLQPRDVRLAIGFCALALLAAAAMFGVLEGNWFPLIFAPLVLLWLGLYGYAKRYTLLAHFVLGVALALSPLAAGLAVHPPYLAEPTLWLLAAFVALWVGGFDIIYAMQDIEVDRRLGLHSIPARLGRPGALISAKAAHLLALLALVFTHRLTPALHTTQAIPGREVSFFLIGLLIVTGLLLIEHRAASRDRFTMAFFTLNGLISLLLAALGITDVLLTYR